MNSTKTMAKDSQEPIHVWQLHKYFCRPTQTTSRTISMASIARKEIEKSEIKENKRIKEAKVHKK